MHKNTSGHLRTHQKARKRLRTQQKVAFSYFQSISSSFVPGSLRGRGMHRGALPALIEILNSLARHGVQPIPAGADAAAAKALYKRLLLVHHPDKVSSGDYCKRSFLTLQRAWETYQSGRVPTYPAPGEENGAGYDEEDNGDADSNAGSEHEQTGKTRKGWRVDLITFAFPKDDPEGKKTPDDFTRKSFGELCKKVYEDVYTGLKVEYFAVFRELHKGSDQAHMRRPHYHVAIKTNKLVLACNWTMASGSRVFSVSSQYFLRLAQFFGMSLSPAQRPPCMSPHFYQAV